MENSIFYTAVDHFRRKTDGNGQSYPVILINQEEYLVDIQEMSVWTILSWRLFTYQQAEEEYNWFTGAWLTSPTRTFESCLKRLEVRGLVASGSGNTDFEALYDLLGGLSVVPLSESLPLRLATFLKLIFGGTPFSTARELFQRDKPSQLEARVMALSRQATLSTAELVKCAKVVISVKRTNPLWGSSPILIGVVIAVLSLLKGTWATAALIIAFALWGLWLIWTQLLPAWNPNRMYRRREHRCKRRQEAVPDDSDASVSLILLRHVNHRISEHLKSAFPKAHWEWNMSDPARFVAQGGTGRIRVYGFPDYDFADVTLNRQGGLRCFLVKVAPLDGSQAASPNQQTLDPRVWYDFQGRSILEDIIADLDSRGHSSLTMNEDGSIRIQPADGGEEIARDAFPSFPEKVYWPRLVNVLNQEGLTADMQDTGILVSW